MHKEFLPERRFVRGCSREITSAVLGGMDCTDALAGRLYACPCLPCNSRWYKSYRKCGRSRPPPLAGEGVIENPGRFVERRGSSLSIKSYDYRTKYHFVLQVLGQPSPVDIMTLPISLLPLQQYKTT